MEREELEKLRDDELEGYIGECLQVLRVLSDQGSPSFERVRQSYFADMSALVELGRITPDEYNELTNEDNFSF